MIPTQAIFVVVANWLELRVRTSNIALLGNVEVSFELICGRNENISSYFPEKRQIILTVLL